MADCAICHAPVSGPDGAIAMPDLHVDGIVQVLVPTTCDGCHGSGPLGAPPPDLSGGTATTLSGVGAHTIHLSSSGPYRPVACSDCHDVPDEVLDAGHIDSFGPAEVDFGGVAKAFSASPSYDGATCNGTWCHGGKTAFGFPSGGSNTAPGWTDPQTGLTCTSCHGMPPPTPAHPPAPTFCTPCHSNVDGLGGFVDPNLHVNGFIDL
jgi:predicted CxxxxCH...CXXCH cytochrome family protein